MKTVLFRQHGGPEVLEYTDFPAPESKPGEALIRLHAATRNRMDVLVRFAKHLSIIGSTMGMLDDFTEVMDLVTAGKLKPAIDSTFPLREAAAAQQRLWCGENFGKITLDIS
jgi:NADPH:quinone reductase-like Zn-dependent oxidoreductase